MRGPATLLAGVAIGAIAAARRGGVSKPVVAYADATKDVIPTPMPRKVGLGIVARRVHLRAHRRAPVGVACLPASRRPLQNTTSPPPCR